MLFSQIKDPTELGIPDDVTGCSVLVRHSRSVQDGPDNARTLSAQGTMLCEAVRPAYDHLFALLAGRFGLAKYGHSGLPRALITAWEITRASHIFIDDHLRLAVSLKRIRNGRWYKEKQANKATVSQMLAEVVADPSLVADQPYDYALTRMASFFRQGYEGTSLSIGFGHEPEPSLYMASASLVPTAAIGLDECQAYIVFRYADGSLAVIKFMPEATVRPVE